MAMNMHRVRGREADAGQDQTNGRVGAHIEDAVLGRETVVAKLGFEAAQESVRAMFKI